MNIMSHSIRTAKQKTVVCATVFFVLASFSCMNSGTSVSTPDEIDALPADTEVIGARFLPVKHFPKLARFKQLTALTFHTGWGVGEAAVTDEGLRVISEIGFSDLDTIMLSHCNKITDEGLRYVVKIESLKWIGLSACPGITDAGISTLATATQLETVDLRGCPNITDVGLERMHAMTWLIGIRLDGCPNISDDAVAKLRIALSDCEVTKDDKAWEYANDTS